MSGKNFGTLSIIGILAFLNCGGNNVFADQILLAKLSNGTPIQLRIQGLSRLYPKSSIVVCGETSHDDVLKLNSFSKQFLPTEDYTIVDGESHPPKSKLNSATFVFFGKPTTKNIERPCVKAVQGFKEYISLRAKIIQIQTSKLNAKLKKQFESDVDPLSKNYCAPDGSLAHINGEAFDWSAQLWTSNKRSCLRAYWALFGFDQLCLTDRCEASEEDIIVKRLGW